MEGTKKPTEDAPLSDAYDITRYGAQPRETFDNAPMLQAAIDACHLAGGGTVLIPAPGTYMSGPIELKSHITLCIETGATLLAHPDEGVYTKSAFRDNPGEGTMWLYGEKISHLTITGGGRIDGNGVSFMGKELDDSYELKPFDTIDPRPHVLTLIGGNTIRIHDMHIGNSAYWTIHLIGCDGVRLSNLTILNSVKVRNSDGIDLDHSKNVDIRDCRIESGDDSICIKNRREYAEFGASENITISNCDMMSSSCAFKIGSENMDAIRNVICKDSVIRSSNRGIGIQNRDEGTVTHVSFSNITVEGRLFSDHWWGKAEPIYITAYRRANGNHRDENWRFAPGETEGRVGAVSDIEFDRITCKSENGIYVSAESDELISDIRFKNIDVTISKPAEFPGGFYDRRPSAIQGLVEAKTAGFFIENAKDITLQNSSVTWTPSTRGYFGESLETRNVTHLSLEHWETEPVKK